jgi:exopolysaccharide/PEP-CTERM locus tyrosine autokinase
MSIVERALQKVRQSAGVAAPSPVFGRIVENARVDAQLHAKPPVPSRIITLNQAALRAAGLLPPAHQERQIANQYRQIKRPLVDNAVGRAGTPALPAGQIIMLASAMSGEGKTFTAINLAFSMAREKDVRVLLVDADVIKPQISKMFGIDEERGLLDALVDHDLDIESLILATDVPNLSVLPAGPPSDQATELFSSARMVALLRELTRHDPSRLILFDSSPLLLTTESRALAQIVGQIVVVVRADHTQQDVLLDALSYLPEGAHTSLVLNQSVVKGEAAYYYYGYGTPERGGGS